MYKFGTIVLIPFPFTDLTSAKLRPALIISKSKQKSSDVIVAFISSQSTEKNNPCSYTLLVKDPYFQQTGLKIDSCFRFDKIATLHHKLILGELGSMHSTHIKKMKKSFEAAFGF